MTGEGTYWCPACLQDVNIARDDEGQRVYADHNDPELAQLCPVSGKRNGWDDRP
ncbi:hypothetical protein KNT58_gp79 [Mycobacterium phage Fortunato]|uniref:Uncharacterized protein n=6 Tax=Coopervirus TaxID=1982898 RepID=A0A5Q2WQY7_9CAUD|nr:hypothetical protein KNT58_gp79 [Mycobacterium phage Fortunato]AXH47444.1 hypothetical protein SEA_HANGMAN_81 [Mycobacterium phage Hangman]QFG09014.1 hypothetical protein SEA_MAGPIE_78 [Mycobacterium phage Magpie]QGH80173.1 hypothetical protein SEA_MITHRIL_80 [Mycobacterium phage Mithril]QJD51383.1 hypothetical protein SEA_RAWRGERTHAT_80 [Mycobacterium phage RawrgerThat]QOC58641.1 hypothetical protein SEALOLALOVE_82 [Mycobacterium phage Lolalove]QQV92974.1 hypothetical protein SEA_HYDRO_81